MCKASLRALATISQLNWNTVRLRFGRQACSILCLRRNSRIEAKDKVGLAHIGRGRDLYVRIVDWQNVIFVLGYLTRT